MDALAEVLLVVDVGMVGLFIIFVPYNLEFSGRDVLFMV